MTQLLSLWDLLFDEGDDDPRSSWRSNAGDWFARSVDDLLMLEIETDHLTSPWRSEQLEGADQPYPHVYGPVDLDSVVAVHSL